MPHCVRLTNATAYHMIPYDTDEAQRAIQTDLQLCHTHRFIDGTRIAAPHQGRAVLQPMHVRYGRLWSGARRGGA